MGKIPVLQTIAETYAFAFRRYFQILGVLWLPVLLIVVAGYYLLVPAMTAMISFLQDALTYRQQHPGAYLPPAFWIMMRGIFLFELCVIVLFTVIGVGITKEALQTRRGPWFVYLDIGKSELLVLGGYFTMVLLYLGAIIVLVIVGGIVGVIVAMIVAGSAHGDPQAAIAPTFWVAQGVGWMLDLVILYFFVRLTFFLVPVSTAEGRFGLWRSWTLTKGNFWRSIGVVLGTFLPATIIPYAIWYVAFGSGLFQDMVPSHRPDLAIAHMQSMMQEFTTHMLYIGIYFIVLAPINYGLMFAQSAFAYRALTGDKAAGL